MQRNGGSIFQQSLRPTETRRSCPVVIDLTMQMDPQMRQRHYRWKYPHLQNPNNTNYRQLYRQRGRLSRSSKSCMTSCKSKRRTATPMALTKELRHSRLRAKSHRHRDLRFGSGQVRQAENKMQSILKYSDAPMAQTQALKHGQLRAKFRRHRDLRRENVNGQVRKADNTTSGRVCRAHNKRTETPMEKTQAVEHSQHRAKFRRYRDL